MRHLAYSTVAANAPGLSGDPTRNTGRVFRWSLLGALLGAAGAALLFAPAVWLAGAVQQASGQRLLLLDTRGTLWDGSARLVLGGGPGSVDAAALSGRLSWTLRPRLDGAQLQLLVPCCSSTPLDLSASASWSGARLHVNALDLSLPAALLSGLGAPWNTLGLQGRLRLRSQSFSVQWQDGQVAMAGLASLDLGAMSSRLSPLRPLGDYRLDVHDGAPQRLTLRTVGEAALLLSGAGHWDGARLVFEGEAAAAPEREEALSNLLNIIGRRQGPRSLITLG